MSGWTRSRIFLVSVSPESKRRRKTEKRRGRKKTGVRAPARVYIYTRAARLSPQKVGRSDARKIADRVKAVVESLFARVMSRPAVRLGKKKDVAKTRTEQRQWSISVRASLSLSKNRSWSLSRTARLASWRASLSLKFFRGTLIFFLETEIREFEACVLVRKALIKRKETVGRKKNRSLVRYVCLSTCVFLSCAPGVSKCRPPRKHRTQDDR